MRQEDKGEEEEKIEEATTPKSNGVPSFAAKSQDAHAVRTETISRFCKGGASGLISAFLLQPL